MWVSGAITQIPPAPRPTLTTTKGVYSGRDMNGASPAGWLKTDTLILSGHSGGPVIDTCGKVAGWAVKSEIHELFESPV